MASKYRDSTREAIWLEHHVFDGSWMGRLSKPHPMRLVKMTPSPQDHHVSFVGPIRDASKLTSVTMSMLADTGSQSIIIPLKFMYALGIRKQYSSL